MAENPKRVVNVEPHNTEVATHNNGTFTLEFSEWREGVNVVVRVTMNDFFVPFIVDHLRSVATKRAEEAKRLLDCFAHAS